MYAGRRFLVYAACPSFVAWCIEVLLRRGPLAPRTCPNCRLPWLGERGADYCNRPAPGRLEKCRSIAAHHKYVDEHGDFHLQRRRVYDRMNRGTLPEKEYRAWLAANRPGELGVTWVRFEDWKDGKRPSAGRRRKEGKRG